MMFGTLIEDYDNDKLRHIRKQLKLAVWRCEKGWCPWMLELWKENLQLVHEEMRMRGLGIYL